MLIFAGEDKRNRNESQSSSTTNIREHALSIVLEQDKSG